MKKISVILTSLLMAFVIMSGGYGLWSKEVIIEGDIKVVPDPKVIEGIEASIEQKYKEIEELEEQKLIEEQEKQKKEEELNKKLEEKLNDESNKVDNTDQEEIDGDIKEVIIEIIDSNEIYIDEEITDTTAEEDIESLEENDELEEDLQP